MQPSGSIKKYRWLAANQSLGHLWDNLRASLTDLWPGIVSLLLAIPVAYGIHIINRFLPYQQETLVLIALVFCFLVASTPAVIFLIKYREQSNPSTLALLVIASVAVVLVGIYVFWVSTYVNYRGDFLIWSESDFVNDILKFRLGYPIYTDQRNNESFTYVPGPQILTYLLAWLAGSPMSIPVYRMVQVGYTVLATIGAFFCGRLILKISTPEEEQVNIKGWSILWLPVLFLLATNSLTNPFVHALHDDALAQLWSVLSYYLFLAYISKKDNRVLFLMAIVPAVGFLIKQSLIVWGALFVFHFLFFDRPFSWKRIAGFITVNIGTLGLIYFACYLIWGENFNYWIFTVLGSHGVSPLRSFQHLLDIWFYFAIGLFGGLVLIRGHNARLLVSSWLIWLAIIGAQTYTSGIAWMINHIGPGSLIAGVWFLAGLVRIWPAVVSFTRSGTVPYVWLRSGIFLAVILLVLNGLGVVRIPLPPLPDDANRYLNEIESEFAGGSAENILLDVGTWVYFEEGIVMMDRAPSIGERGYSETGDFSDIISRLNQQKYSKILVRAYDQPDFWYDHFLWKNSSGIRQAMQNNYYVVGKIDAVDGVDNYLFDEITILAPLPR